MVLMKELDQVSAWAYSLAELTGSYVIMFPSPFILNRSPDSWKDPRAMTGLA